MIPIHRASVRRKNPRNPSESGSTQTLSSPIKYQVQSKTLNPVPCTTQTSLVKESPVPLSFDQIKSNSTPNHHLILQDSDSDQDSESDDSSDHEEETPVAKPFNRNELIIQARNSVRDMAQKSIIDSRKKLSHCAPLSIDSELFFNDSETNDDTPQFTTKNIIFAMCSLLNNSCITDLETVLTRCPDTSQFLKWASHFQLPFKGSIESIELFFDPNSIEFIDPEIIEDYSLDSQVVLIFKFIDALYTLCTL